MATNPGRRSLQLVDDPVGAVSTEGTIPPAARAYRRSIARHAERIRRTSDAGTIVDILDKAIQETRALHDREILAEARRRAAIAESEIEQLRAELALVTGLLREDPLTGALNRRGLDDAFDREAARAEREASRLSAVLLDLDHFKQVNDQHGHAAGDQALALVAQVVGGALRPTDVFARHGGEEFAVLLPGAGAEDARLCTLRVQAALASQPLLWSGKRVPLTFSAGVTEVRPGERLAECLVRADDALYAAKRAGRNRVKITL